MFSVSLIIFLIFVLVCIGIDHKFKNIKSDFAIYLIAFIVLALADNIITRYLPDESELNPILSSTRNRIVANYVSQYPDIKSEYEALFQQRQSIKKDKHKSIEKVKNDGSDLLEKIVVTMEACSNVFQADNKITDYENKILEKMKTELKSQPLWMIRDTIRPAELCLILFAITCILLMILSKAKVGLRSTINMENTFSFLFWNFVVLALYDIVKGKLHKS